MSGTSSWTRRLRAHLATLYPDADLEQLTDAAIQAVGIDDAQNQPEAIDALDRWGPDDAVLIAYGDSIVDGDQAPLAVLAQVVNDHLRPAVTVVHVLPFHPYTSDRGFSVVDYTTVDEALGTWHDLGRLGATSDLMLDLVCNHVSVRSRWFRQFLADEAPGRDYFVTAPGDADTTAVVRPRAQPLLQRFETATGPRHVWCTFSANQADLDYTNPAVLLEVLRIIDLYVRRGARFIRLDAVAYLWKTLGTASIHLPQTHEVLRLWHTLLERRAPQVSLVSETNVPTEENLTYFGDRDEAHLVYNFSLPPLVIDALLNGCSDDLTTWAAGLPPAPAGCAYLNLLASHDGIGLRPAEGLLNEDQVATLVRLTHERGGLSGSYDTANGPRPYELNISLWDLLSGTAGAVDDGWVRERFLCAHAIMLGLAGVPAVYVNSLFARPNDRGLAETTGVRRDITRARIDAHTVRDIIADTASPEGRANSELLRLLQIRGAQPAFHPNARQVTIELGSEVFGFWRQRTDSAPRDHTQRILAVHNCTAQRLRVSLNGVDLTTSDAWHDLVSDEALPNPVGDLVLGPYQTRWITNIVIPG